MKRLEVWLGGQLVGHLLDLGSGQIGFSYAQGWRDVVRKGQAHPISVTLPLRPPGEVQDATAFVAGLLPDSTRHRSLLAEELGIEGDPSDFAFLAKLGRDSAGALLVVPEGAAATGGPAPAIDWLEEADLAARLRALPRRPLMVDDAEDITLSLAGVNDKAAVVMRRGRIGLPRHGHPSTHIIKIDIPGLTDSIETEHFCLSLAGAVGIPVPTSRILQAEDQRFLIVNRYDRFIDGGKLARKHQEDFCQAMNVMPGRKYQRKGGPGWAECFALMAVTTNPTESRRALLRYAIFQFLSGNPDAHAKNYSLVYANERGGINLAPLYDLNNAAAFRGFFKSAKPIMAMAIGEQSDRDAVTVGDWETFADTCGLRREAVLEEVRTMAENILSAIRTIQAECRDCEAVRIAAEDISDRCRHWCRPPAADPDIPSEMEPS